MEEGNSSPVSSKRCESLTSYGSAPVQSENTKTTRLRRQFDFSKHPKRRIALMFLYFGWEYNGLVQQRELENTVEQHMKEALLKTRLIESWEQCGWNRCGRTDKHVSAFRQVASVVVRSRDRSSPGAVWPPGSEPQHADPKPSGDCNELPYDAMLNGVLPQSVRVLAWARVPMDFSARHDCDERSYTYALPACSYNIEAMRKACRLLVGEHDFRNFCRIDMNKDRVGMGYVRRITHAEVVELSGDCCSLDAVSRLSPYDFLLLAVRGSGFLWHQMRCIVALLREIGLGNEQPEVVSELLDVKTTPSKPVYGLAPSSPLCLFDCSFNTVLNWQWNIHTLRKIRSAVLKKWSELQSMSFVLKGMAEGIGELAPELRDDYSGVDAFVRSTGPASKTYVRLRDRQKCDSLECKQEKMQRKRRRCS